MKLSGFGRAGVWDPAVEDASDLSYAPYGVPLKHAAPEVSAAEGLYPNRIIYDRGG